MKINNVLQGDCKESLKGLKDSSIDLIYLDPPFYTQKKQVLKNRDNSKKYEFEDSWDSIDEYASYIENRLIEMRRVLKDTGSIFLHCDRNASHYLRIALDNAFGSSNFQSEIIWSYKRWSNAKKGLLNSHQVIFFYSKSSKFKFNTIYTDYSVTTNIDQIFQERERDGNGKSTYKTDSDGEVKLQSKKKGVPLSDVWEIPYLNPKANERVGYPTQKPILLLEQIVLLVTDEGDFVLDPFCGSGTTLVASKLLNRNYIGIDQSKEAVELSRERLDNPVKTESHLLKNGKDKYINKNEFIEEVLKSFDYSRVQRNTGIDAFLKIKGMTLPIPIKIQQEGENFQDAVNKLKKASEKNKFERKIIFRTSHKDKSPQLFDVNEMLDSEGILVIDLKN